MAVIMENQSNPPVRILLASSAYLARDIVCADHPEWSMLSPTSGLFMDGDGARVKCIATESLHRTGLGIGRGYRPDVVYTLPGWNKGPEAHELLADLTRHGAVVQPLKPRDGGTLPEGAEEATSGAPGARQGHTSA